MRELRITNADIADANLAVKLLTPTLAVFRDRLLAAGFKLDPRLRIMMMPSLDLKGYVLTQAEEKPAVKPLDAVKLLERPAKE
jgi:hypothetical protein